MNTKPADGEWMVPVMKALTNARNVFKREPWREDDETKIAGCGDLTFDDLHTLWEYATKQFNREDGP